MKLNETPTNIPSKLQKFWHFWSCLTLKVSNMDQADFANSVDPDEVAHYEPPHLDQHCSPLSL